MAQARSNARRRRRAGDRSAEHWLLLLGFTIIVAIVAGSIDPVRWRAEEPPIVRRPLTMAQARVSNAAVPIEGGERKRAEPFVFRGGPAAREQAIECLATAAIYEAGRDTRERKAVMQVVLNRVGHPGYAKTVCGVVYQGADRSTGCQFSFACDGSVRRRPEHEGWLAARRLARRALHGYVFAAVGRAINYHTDWSVPYWRDSLIKVARVKTHLFYVSRDRSEVPSGATKLAGLTREK